MFQNGQTHFQNPAAFTTRFWLNVSDNFGILNNEGLKFDKWNVSQEITDSYTRLKLRFNCKV